MSAKQNLFNSVKINKPKRSVFDLSHDVKLSLDAGLLYPTLVMETMPGDKFHIGCESLVRMAPMVAPIMHRVDVYMHYFFVPNRLVWPNWEKYITNTPLTPGGSLPAHPTIPLTAATWNAFKLHDYMGVPSPGGHTYDINAIPYAAYQMIYNEYYRDQNLVAAVDYALVDGDNAPNTDLTVIRRRAWEHDYFTSALPWAQKGEEVNIPLQDVVLNGDSGDAWIVKEAAPPNAPMLSHNPLTGNAVNGRLEDQVTGTELILDPNGTLEVESTSINNLRRAFRLQEWLEKAARGGSRYVENIKSFFGVTSSDARLNRPEYITGTKSPVIISEVLQTSDDAAGSTPQGNMAGHGVSVQSGRQGGYFCEEHGFIIGVMSILPKTAYADGIHKKFRKTASPMDSYAWPTFAHIGEQAVLNSEVYAPGIEPNGTFGYVPRYAEYKFEQSRICGDFRSSLDYWHWGRMFGSTQYLNQTFIECNPDDRIFAVTASGTDNFYAHILHKISAVRPLPKFGTPTF